MQETIILPTDPARIEQLHKKLVEYQQRISPFYGPETQQDPMYKALVLSTLLERGGIEFGDLHDTVKKNYPAMQERMFLNAWNVIRDYCETGGKHVYGGRLPTR